MFIVFDLDGTLADFEHRRKFIQNRPRNNDEYWTRFYKACTEDKPIVPMIELFKAVHGSLEHRIEIWTGRSDIVEDETRHWILKHTNIIIRPRMRKHGDTTPDWALKKGWLLSSDTKVDLVFEDRPSCVDMFRSEGVTVAQLQSGVLA